MMTGLVKRSITLKGHRTSISLEPEFWSAIEKIAVERKQSVSDLISEIDGIRTTSDDEGLQSLSSALRVFALKYATAQR